MIKATLFDLGDTVFHPDWIKIDKQMIKETGLSILLKGKLKEIYDNKVLTGKVSIKDFFELLLKDSNSNKIVEDVMKDYKNAYEKHSPIHKEILNLIKKLRKNFKILALSNTSSIHKEVNTKRGVFSNFDKSFLSFEMGIRKPDKKVYSTILKETKLKPEEIIFIDNNEGNIKNACSIGFMGIKYVNYNKLVDDLKRFGVY